MKRYLVFAYYHYYPGGGWNDFVSAHDNLAEAEDAAIAAAGDWREVIDLETLTHAWYD